MRRVSSLPIELTAGGAAAAELLRRAGAPEPGCRDELRDGNARLRTPWKHFAQWLPAEGLAADLERRGAALAAQIRPTASRTTSTAPRAHPPGPGRSSCCR